VPPLTNIRPRAIIAIALIVSLILITSAFIELRQSTDEVFHLLTEEAMSLVETIDRGSANILLSAELIEQLIFERLLNNATLVATLDSVKRLSRDDLVSIAGANDLYRINVFDSDGRKLLSNHAEDPGHRDSAFEAERTAILRPLLDGSQSVLMIGMRPAPIPDEFRYAVGVRRTRPGGGAIVVNIDAERFVEFRRRVGIGKLISDLGDNSGIEYVVLQDDMGILAASKAVEEMSSIESDSILAQALSQDTVLTRRAMFSGREVFEVVAPHRVDDQLVGLLRVGLSMEEVQATEARMQRRALAMTGVLVVIGVLSLVAIVSGKSYRLLSREYSSFQSMTATILERMGDAVITVDHQRRIALINQQAEHLLSMPASEVQGRRTDELSARHQQLLKTLFDSPEGLAELELPASDGSIRTVSASLTLVTDNTTGESTRTVVIRDLTDQRRSERELQRREKLSAMGELASGLAHEIRNPVNAMSMIAQRLEKEFAPAKDPDEYRHLTKVLKSEIGRVTRNIQRFLEFARPQKPTVGRVSLDQFFSHVSALFEGQASAKGVRFSATMESAGTSVFDREQMTQALLNLLQNALDATPQGGSIRLTGTVRRDTTILTVADTGAGIPRDKTDTIFNLYYTTKDEGTGMGLPITQQIVSQHGGQITVTSTPGTGTVFTVVLPSGEPG
jgi:two-component system sensor histidine kinase HydH